MTMSTLSEKMKALEAEEFILNRNPNRTCLFPIVYPDFWEWYKKAQASFWTAEEIDFSMDYNHWHKLNKDERHFITNVLAFFAASDGIVLENLALKFLRDVKIPEAQSFYSFQIAVENIHSETYSLLIENYVKDEAEKRRLFMAIETIDAVKDKANWAKKWITDENSFAERIVSNFKNKLINYYRIVAYAAVEGILFSGSFCALFWLKKRGLMPGLTFSNELIARDEGLHADFGCFIYHNLKHKLPEEAVQQIIKEAVVVERSYICDSLPCDLIGMNSQLMTQYIEFVADRLLQSLGVRPVYNVTNPFDWMQLISVQVKFMVN
ncbi:ribonucleotide reductase R2 subunit or ribonucleoside-diphosphate reductase small chain, putative [Theileria annulata]|uniref:Ribonucleotide reductase R2 subunit or ribonucleoside-diphosphate reductase small chain, putative n=1 Tax=Theileria annulata TaxID=5874 RepID=Q4UHR4_THEAN|nr:ribonucleotide reductase R2 subunit or ribonucleoside-diphosphate reductase small chain, putative [Theileria annulata]CAI73375.1 ribonucleotide reductase R2 subunit or ribonucleoside-diphosphate reductase small chain, putative [Theileria annulata]|eukprot:XP_954052.1 ribonucleotide reductase R2 subunit or ribonucleoside-diphosphate reductase small chain, putative [Theileria annulata]